MCRYIRPVALNLLNEEEKRQAVADLDRLVRENGYRLNTGFLTTHELCRTLSDYGYVKSAYRLLLNEDTPGWLSSVKHGATTVPEHWDAYDAKIARKDSMNHYAYGAIAGWLMDTVAGIRIKEGKIFLQPKPYKELESVKAVYQSPAGIIKSAWKYYGEMIRYQVEIPCNTEAELEFPDGTICRLEPGTHVFLKQEFEG